MKTNKRITLIAGCLFGSLLLQAQTAKLLSPRNLSRWEIPYGDYSGITPIGNRTYAIVSDKSDRDGFYVVGIRQDSLTGQVTDMYGWMAMGKETNGQAGRDAEGIAFFPTDSTLWISGESDQRIVAYNQEGQALERELQVPSFLAKDKIYPNYGFEALAYDAHRHLFWTVTENVLKADGQVAAPGHEGPFPLRLQAFTPSGQPERQYTYWLDTPQAKRKDRQYAFGVVALCVLPDGQMYALEREFDVKKHYLGSRVRQKLYRVVFENRDSLSACLSQTEYAVKKIKVAEWNTQMRLIGQRLANYEGLCQGIVLKDGRQTLLMISDSQHGYGRKWCHLKDWIRVVILP